MSNDETTDQTTDQDPCSGCGEVHSHPMDGESGPFTLVGPEVDLDEAGPKMTAWVEQIKPRLEEILDIAREHEIDFFAHARCDVSEDGTMVSGASSMHLSEAQRFLGVKLHGVAIGHLIPVPASAIAEGMQQVLSVLDAAVDDDAGPDGRLLN